MQKLLTLILLSLSATTYAHEPMAHACTPPERPLNEQDDVAWQAFMTGIDTFRDCVNDKMAWHEAAADIHSDNALLIGRLELALERHMARGMFGDGFSLQNKQHAAHEHDFLGALRGGKRTERLAGDRIDQRIASIV